MKMPALRSCPTRHWVGLAGSPLSLALQVVLYGAHSCVLLTSDELGGNALSLPDAILYSNALSAPQLCYHPPSLSQS